MTKLYTNKPKRLFTFGCSFTSYSWSSWANILALELDCEFYNFGAIGVGNSYISTIVTQADAVYNFNENDLVIVCWTNVSREDRWIKNRGWVTPGNIYTQNEFTGDCKKWIDEFYYAQRDYSYIKLVNELLKNKTQYHFLQMLDITKMFDQWTDEWTDEPDLDSVKMSNLLDIHKHELGLLHKSYYDVLWDGEVVKNKMKEEFRLHSKFKDGHPNMLEHLQYLQHTFDYDFSQDTIDIVNNAHNKWEDFVRNGEFLTTDWCDVNDFQLSKSNKIDKRINIKS